MLSPKFLTSLKLDVISTQVLQNVEDSCKKCIKKKICKYFQFGGENVKICDLFLMFKIFFNKDLLKVLMVKLQTVDIDLGRTRLSFFSCHEICPEIRQMHTMSYKTAMENVNNLRFKISKCK